MRPCAAGLLHAAQCTATLVLGPRPPSLHVVKPHEATLVPGLTSGVLSQTHTEDFGWHGRGENKPGLDGRLPPLWEDLRFPRVITTFPMKVQQDVHVEAAPPAGKPGGSLRCLLHWAHDLSVLKTQASYPVDCRPPAGALGHGRSEAHSSSMLMLSLRSLGALAGCILLLGRERADMVTLLFLTPGKRRLRHWLTPVSVLA